MIKSNLSVAFSTFCAAFTVYAIGSWLLDGSQSADIEGAIYTGLAVSVGVVLGNMWRTASATPASEATHG